MSTNSGAAPHTRPRISINDAPFATITVGTPETRFVVHKDLLTFHSPFFRAALTGHFKEAEEKAVTLSTERSRVFEFFVHWLYHQRFPDTSDAPELLSAWSDGEHHGWLKTGNLIYLYVFCDKYNVKSLRVQVMNELFEHLSNPAVDLPDSIRVNYAFTGLPESSPLRRYLIDVHCCYAGKSVWEDLETAGCSWPFLKGVMQQYTSVRTDHKLELSTYKED